MRTPVLPFESKSSDSVLRLVGVHPNRCCFICVPFQAVPEQDQSLQVSQDARACHQPTWKDQFVCSRPFFIFSKSRFFCAENGALIFVCTENGAFLRGERCLFAESRNRPSVRVNLVSEIGRFGPTVRCIGTRVTRQQAHAPPPGCSYTYAPWIGTPHGAVRGFGVP